MDIVYFLTRGFEGRDGRPQVYMVEEHEMFENTYLQFMPLYRVHDHGSSCTASRFGTTQTIFVRKHLCRRCSSRLKWAGHLWPHLSIRYPLIARAMSRNQAALREKGTRWGTFGTQRPICTSA